MDTYYYFLITLIGLSLGSFFNVIIFRFTDKRGIVKGRSKCVSCGSVVKWYDLIPIFSYFILKGKCRKCKNKISPLYPIVEASTAIVLLLFFLNTPQLSYLSTLNVFILLLLLLIIFLDIRYFTIPDKILISITAATVWIKSLDHNTNFAGLLISALGLASFFAILFLVSKGKWLGLGDVKLIFIIGLLLGYPLGYLAVISSIWAAAIFSILLLATKKADMKTRIPFGSFLSAATIIFLIFNHELREISRYFY